MSEVQDIDDWRGKTILVDDGAKIGKLEEVYIDAATLLPVFGSIVSGGGALGSIEERGLYHHDDLAYALTATPSGRRLARR